MPPGAPPQPQAWSAAPQTAQQGPAPTPAAAPAAYQAPYSPYGDEVYDPQFDLRRVHPSLLGWWHAYGLSEFSPAGAVVLNLITGGWFGLIFYGIQHGRFPKASQRDFGTGQAIGYYFIPVYNFYWMFRFWCGLVDRVNLQLRLNNYPVPLVSRSLATGLCILRICSILPLVGVAAAICEAILVSNIQTAINAVVQRHALAYQQAYGR